MTGSSSILDEFEALHHGEEELRGKSLKLIGASSDLSAHINLIERGQDLLFKLIHDGDHKDDDDLAIRLIGIRLFNSSASCLKLLLSGYYQNAAVQMRDLLETAFLLDYFLTDAALVAEWRTSDKSKRLSKFGPAKVRTALDKRDGFTERKREAAYSLLCELAAHPTYAGFQMLLVDGENVHCGPFLEPKAMGAALSEFAKTHMQAVTAFNRFFGFRTVAIGAAKIDYLDLQGRWLTRFFNGPDNSAMIKQLRADLAMMERVAQS